MTLNDALLGTFVSAIALWLGGSIASEIWVAAARRSGGTSALTWALPLITRLHGLINLPLAALACGSALWFSWRMGAIFQELWWIRLPGYLYIATVGVTTTFVVPEYRKVAQMLKQLPAAEVERRLTRVAWVSRVQIAAMVASLWNATLHLGL